MAIDSINIIRYARVSVFNSINYNLALNQKTKPSFFFFGLVKGNITKICQMVISFILFIINQVMKIRFKTSSKLISLFLICFQTAYSQKCIIELIFQLLLCSGYIESNPGPKKLHGSLFAFRTWIALLRMIFQKGHYWRSWQLLASMILYIYQKYFLTLQSKVMTKD